MSPNSIKVAGEQYHNKNFFRANGEKGKRSSFVNTYNDEYSQGLLQVSVGRYGSYTRPRVLYTPIYPRL